MAPEIADSDAESDLNSPAKKAVAKATVLLVDQAEPVDPSQVSLSKYDFDQFLDPTQRLSSLSPSHTNSVPTASELLAGLPSGSSEPTMPKASKSSSEATGPATKKRAHSAFQDGTTASKAEDFINPSSSKRTKTYAHSAKSRSSLRDIDLFGPSAKLSHFASPGSATLPAEEQSIAVPDHNVAHPTETIMTNDSDATAPISLLGRSTGDTSHRLTTSMASMGQYSSINIDLRGSAQGLDVLANPFGSSSQVSLEDMQIPAREEVDALRPPANNLDLGISNLTHNATSGDASHENLPAVPHFSQNRPVLIDPSWLMQHDGPTADFNAQYGPRATEATIGFDVMVPPTESIEAVTEKPAPKKRGRKPKNPRLSSKSPAPDTMNGTDEFVLPNLPLAPVDRSRQGTVDSVSTASHNSSTNTSTKRRKRSDSKQVPEAVEPMAAIGVSSPVKQPTSELNLSDEALIGLPKDQYKPRPSRSRSKKVIGEESPLRQDIEQQTPSKSQIAGPQDPTAETPPTTSAKSSTKKGRKAKVKRAKTSAAALLKKGDPMLSEGEEDVVWMDTMPATVRLDLPPDLKVLKKETEAADAAEGKKTGGVEVEFALTTETETKVTVEIPTEAKDPTAGPKKRGRKPKKIQKGPDPGVVVGEEKKDEEDMKTRPVLAEKSTNLPTNHQATSNSRDPRAPTVSPLSSPEPEKQPTLPEKNPSDTVALTTIMTPSKESTQGKGPLTHSPIKSSNLSSSKKVTYRIGLSRRQNIPSLLRRVQRDKPAPKIVVRKEKESKKKKNGDDDGENSGLAGGEMRGTDGMLVEWDF